MGVVEGFVVFLGLAVLFTGLEYLGVYRLRPHRVDIAADASPFSGRSVFVQVNAYHPKNYSPVGKSKLGWLYAVIALRSVAALGAAWFGYWTFFGR